MAIGVQLWSSHYIQCMYMYHSPFSCRLTNDKSLSEDLPVHVLIPKFQGHTDARAHTHTHTRVRTKLRSLGDLARTI